MSTILSASDAEKKLLETTVEFFTAAAPPPESVLTSMKAAGFNITHLYGLSETYGPAVVNEWHQNWNQLNENDQASLKARQGVRYLPLESLAVMDPETMKPVPRDGKTIGEVMFRGNVVMKGYLKNKLATEESFKGGWFHSGDLGVIHEDGYILLKDRSKDIKVQVSSPIKRMELKATDVSRQFPVLIQAIDFDVLEEVSRLEFVKVVGLLDPSSSDGYVRKWEPYTGSIEKHIGYAIQWFLMALVLAIIGLRIVLKRRKK